MVQLVVSEEWEAPIGRVFLAFGSIEHAIYLALRDIPSSQISRSASKMPLSTRIDLLLEVLGAYQGASYSELVKSLQQVKSLAKTRNIPAHNGLVFNFSESAAGNFLAEQVISSPGNPKQSITLDELVKLGEAARSLSAKLHAQLADIRKLQLLK